MHDTGLIARPLAAEARAIVFGGKSEKQVHETLELLAQIDSAHTIMLIETNVIARWAGREALRAARSLAASHFESVTSREPVRGWYMAYEAALIELAPTAADVHVGRSRNDIGATLFALRCRRRVADLIGEILRLVRSIQQSIDRDGHVPLPVFSHRRPAMPGTWELYLGAVAETILRDTAHLLAVLQQLDICPLGAGAGAGSEIGIDPARTAALLGFAAPAENSLAAVACRDSGLRAVATAAILGSTLSRLAADLMVWYAEQYAITLPDELVGASSAMPQKRNAFILEHVLGKTGRVAGALTAALAAGHGAPFSNAVQVGTESADALLDGISLAKDATTLSALIIEGARPVSERFEAIGRKGGVSATTLALEARRKHGLSFREAHHLVGKTLRAATSDDPVGEAAAALVLNSATGGDPSVMAFGAGAAATAAATRRATTESAAHRSQAELESYRTRWVRAEHDLQATVDDIIDL
jgi:argininosuccinate lyase